jgi:hypothetical protein
MHNVYTYTSRRANGRESCEETDEKEEGEKEFSCARCKESKTKTIIETTLNLKVISASAFFVCCSLGICFDGCFLPPYLRPPLLRLSHYGELPG